MRQLPAVSRPAWANALSGLAGSNGVNRKSPVEIVATAACVVTHSPYAEATGLRTGRFGRWTDGVNAMREDCIAFAAYWRAHNERLLAEAAAEAQAQAQARTGERETRRNDASRPRSPLWVVLGDSTAQGLGAPSPRGGYVGQALHQLRRRTGQPWRVLNLSVSGALIRDVLADQIPMLPEAPDLVTCGIGANDVLYSTPARLFSDMRAVLAAVPERTVVLDLPLLAGFWGIVGRISVPYITRINRVIHEVAAERELSVAEISAHFTAPWAGKFASDSFHPSQDGYRDWTRAVLAAIPPAQPLAALPPA
ncbi:MAG TPA: SGNH/GDSL hydrolase family protein [Trebonia sp.]